MAKHGMTDEELALLTEEERAGLEDDDLVDEGEESTEEEQEEPEDQKPFEEEEEEEQPGEQQPEQEEQEQPGRDTGEEEEEEQPAATAPQVPLIRADLPADYDEQVKAIADRRTEIRSERRSLTDKYEDGDMTSKEYHDALDKLEDELSDLNDKRYELKRLEEKAQLAKEMNQSQMETRWWATVEAFVGEHPELTRNQTVMAVYDQIVQRVTAETMKAGKEPGLADLQKAYKQWAEDLGITPHKAAKEPGKQNDTEKQQAQKKARNVPPTLGKVPASEVNDTDDGKYAYLDRLADSDPLKYEAELAKLTEAQFEEYSNS